MKTLRNFFILIVTDLIVAALIQSTQQPYKTLFYIGLFIADILGIIYIISGITHGGDD